MTATSGDSGTIGVTKYANAPGDVGASRGLAQEALAPMHDHSIPTTTEDTTDVREVPLTRGFIALVDAADYERVMQHSWHADPRNTITYAVRSFRVNGIRKNEYLHQFICGKRDGLEIDHKDGDGLNCTRRNLRHLTHQQNAQNRRNVAGVGWHKKTGKWRAYITVDGKQHQLILTDDKNEAIAARQMAVREHFGGIALQGEVSDGA